MAELKDNDPFNAANAPGINLIVSMRLYDVAMGIYTEMNPERAAVLEELHAAGGILLDLPHYNSDDTTKV